MKNKMLLGLLQDSFFLPCWKWSTLSPFSVQELSRILKVSLRKRGGTLLILGLPKDFVSDWLQSLQHLSIVMQVSSLVSMCISAPVHQSPPVCLWDLGPAVGLLTYLTSLMTLTEPLLKLQIFGIVFHLLEWQLPNPSHAEPETKRLNCPFYSFISLWKLCFFQWLLIKPSFISFIIPNYLLYYNILWFV